MALTNDQLNNIEFYLKKFGDEIINIRFHSWKKTIQDLIDQSRLANLKEN